jgi:hypothetical protein
MKKSTIIRRIFVVSLVILMASWAVPFVNAGEPPVKEATPRALATDLNKVAANSVDDTLKACLARIPEVATAGQRLLAEQNCRGEEHTRRDMQVTPRF